MSTVVRYPPIRKIRTKVYGISFRNADGTRRQQVAEKCSPGDPLVLVREPENPYDDLAVAVHTVGNAQLGYLGGHLAHQVTDALESGRRVSAAIINVTGGDGPWWYFRRKHGVNIELTIS